MANGINRRDLLKTFGALSVTMAIGPLPRMIAQSKAARDAHAAQSLVLHFTGLWAFVMGQTGVTALTARVGEHTYRAGHQHLSEGKYVLSGVKSGTLPKLDHELVIYGAGHVDVQSSYAWMELPFPKELTNPPCMVSAEFSGPDACVRSRSFPLRHQLHYDIDPATPLSLGSIALPRSGSKSEIHLTITAEPPARLGDSNHPFTAFDKLMALFPGLNVKLEKIKVNLGCTGVDSYANPENCIQPIMMAARCPGGSK